MAQTSSQTDVIVVGGGPAGLIAAIALARRGVDTILLAPKPPHPDRRTTALLGSSVDILKGAGVWDAIEAKAAPLRKLRLVDGTRRLIRTPEVLFNSGELGLAAFGYNIANVELLAVLRAHLEQNTLRVIEQSAASIELSDAGRVALADGSSVTAKLVVAADGRNSRCRAAAGIRISKRPLPQHAIALNLTHARPHNDVSTEFHTESGPFTLVPMQGLRSSLVWVCKERDVERLRAAADVDLAREIETKSHSMLGAIQIDGPRGIFPLGVEVAERFADKRVALVGESGHVIPPIGAQGLNLGIRDAAAIARLAGDALDAGGDPGSETVLEAYDLERRADVRARAAAVEMLGRSLLTEFLPVHLARGLGLEIASRIPFLRKSLMRGGLGVTGGGREQEEIA
jgi:2-octaprenyl-6-methoxyphenol hydroxylase